jgi:hypothetical protein
MEHHMVQFAIARSFHGMPFYFNLTAPVGRGYPKAPVEDVSLVQFIFVVGARGQNPVPPDLLPLWSNVAVTGRMNDATLAAIDAWQTFRRKKFGATVEADGIVSVVRTETGLYGPGKGMSYDIVHLNFMMLFATASIWPRIDKDARCPPVLGEAIRKALGGHART